MSDQLAFDPGAAEEAREEGQDRAYRAERVQLWKQEASAWLDEQHPGVEFTADDLVAVIGLPDEGPSRNNVVGAWVAAQSKQGRITWTGRFRRSRRVVRHSNLQRVWRVTGAAVQEGLF